MKRLAIIAALGGAALAVTGCAVTPTPETPLGPEAVEETEVPVQEIQGACGLVTSEELESIFGLDLGDGRERQGTVGQNDLTWTPDRCLWEVEDVLEVEVRVADAAAFDTGELACIPPTGSDNVAVDSLGDQAWWRGDDFFGTMLRACTSAYLVDVEIEGDGSPALQAEATELASIVLDRLR